MPMMCIWRKIKFLFSFYTQELPSLLPIKNVAEAMMFVPNGGWFLCRMVANSPDSFKEGMKHKNNNNN